MLSSKFASGNGRAPRIGYVLKRFPRLSETFILNEILELERQGVSVDIFSLKRPLEEPRHEQLSKLKASVTYVSASSANHASLSPEDLRLAGQLSPSKSGKELEALVSKALTIALCAKDRKLQHLHAHFMSDPATAALLAARDAQVSFSFTAHARDIYHCYVSPDVDDHGRRLKLKAAAFTLTVSEYNARHLRLLAGPQKAKAIHCLYNGIDIERFSRTSVPRSRTILFIGRLIEKKGAADLIEACRLLHRDAVTFDCQLIGEGPLRPALEQQIKSAGLEPMVTLHGAQSHDRVLTRMRHARTLVLPSVVAESGDRDGLPTVLLEALSARVPAISTRVAGIPEIIKNNVTGLLVEPGSPNELANAIKSILVDDLLANRLARAGVAEATAKFNLATNVACLHALFALTADEARNFVGKRM